MSKDNGTIKTVVWALIIQCCLTLIGITWSFIGPSRGRIGLVPLDSLATLGAFAIAEALCAYWLSRGQTIGKYLAIVIFAGLDVRMIPSLSWAWHSPDTLHRTARLIGVGVFPIIFTLLLIAVARPMWRKQALSNRVKTEAEQGAGTLR